MLVIVDYGMGNTGSIASALTRGQIPFIVSGAQADIEQADGLILCGVGSFDHGIQQLHVRGLVPLLEHTVLERHTPILGICLGLQLFCRSSTEGNAAGLSWLKADAIKFAPAPFLTIPHIGWNTINMTIAHPLLDSIENHSEFYFMHSYYLHPDDPGDVCADTEHGVQFPAVVAHGNIAGVQFHPEKSGEQGLTFLKNFSHWSPNS